MVVTADVMGAPVERVEKVDWVHSAAGSVVGPGVAVWVVGSVEVVKAAVAVGVTVAASSTVDEVAAQEAAKVEVELVAEKAEGELAVVEGPGLAAALVVAWVLGLAGTEVAAEKRGADATAVEVTDMVR